MRLSSAYRAARAWIWAAKEEVQLWIIAAFILCICAGACVYFLVFLAMLLWVPLSMLVDLFQWLGGLI